MHNGPVAETWGWVLKPQSKPAHPGVKVSGKVGRLADFSIKLP